MTVEKKDKLDKLRINLECKKKQLGMLIENLYKITRNRKNIFSKLSSASPEFENIKQLYSLDSVIEKELKTAKKQYRELNAVLNAVRNNIKENENSLN